MPQEVTREGAAKLLGKLAQEQNSKIRPFSTPKFLSESRDLAAAKALVELVRHPSSRLVRIHSNLKDEAHCAAKGAITEDAFWGIQGFIAGGASEAASDQIMINRKVLGDKSVEEENEPRGLIYIAGPATLRFWEYIHGGSISKRPNFGIRNIRRLHSRGHHYSSDALLLDRHLDVVGLIEHALNPSEEYVAKKLGQLEQLKLDPKIGGIFERAEMQLVVPGQERKRDYNLLRSVQDSVERVIEGAYHTGYEHYQMMSYVANCLMPPKPDVFARQHVESSYSQRRARR